MYILVLGETDFDAHPWLRALTRKLDKEQAKKLVEKERNMEDEDDREDVNAVMEAAVRANRAAFEQAKGEMDDMGQAMMELMKPEIDRLLDEKDRQYGLLLGEMNEKDRQYGLLLGEMNEKDREIMELKRQLAEFQKGK